MFISGYLIAESFCLKQLSYHAEYSYFTKDFIGHDLKKMHSSILSYLYFGHRGVEKEKSLTSGWLQRFSSWNPELALRTPSLLDPARYSMSRSSVMDVFFNDLNKFMTSEGLLHEPSRIYNIDESWFSPKDAKLKKV